MPSEPPNEKEIFNIARAIESPTARAAYLRQVCGEDSELSERISALLAGLEKRESFLEAPAADILATEIRPLTEQPGDVIGAYKLLQQIGEGGMGVVYMAEQTEPVERRVALKIIKPGMDSQQVIARFEAERQALAMMDHPNIAKVLDAGTTETGRPYFVMELVKGMSVTQYCDEQHLTPRERLELFLPICQAVQHAHQKGIIHRDLKPSNILVAQYDNKAVPKIIDFGVAKAVSQKLTEKTMFTQYGQIVGTIEYMSPEQARFNQLDVDTRSDIYSLGVLLYELLTGETPFDKKRLRSAAFDELLRIIREEEPPRPSTKLSSSELLANTAVNRKTEPKKLSVLVRGDLDWIVMKALEKDRNRRYETANAFAADVQRYLSDEPVTACPPSASYRIRKFARRNKAGLTMTAVISLALLVAVGSLGWMVRDRAARETEYAHKQQEQKESLDRKVNESLGEAERLIQQEQWDQAAATAQQVDRLLSAAGRSDRPAGLPELKNDLAMALRLEEIYRHPDHDRMRRIPAETIALDSVDPSNSRTVLTIVSGSLTSEASKEEEEIFAGREQDTRFAAAFREYGIDVDALDVKQAAAQVSQSTIRAALVKSLDDWAAMRRRARGKNDAGWQKLIEVARSADHDRWRNQVREALLAQNRTALEKLADEVSPRTAPPATLVLLADTLKQLGAVEKGLNVLVQAQQQYPDDLWINDYLAWMNVDGFQPPRYADALRFYTVASALRPHAPRWHDAVARMHFYVLFSSPNATIDDRARGQLVSEFSQVINLTPDDPRAWLWRGYCYYWLQQWDESVADCSKALELDPNNAHAWRQLANCYHDKARLTRDNRGAVIPEKEQLDQAIACYKKAIELDPKDALAQNGLGVALKEQGKVDEAVACYQTALELDPEFADAHNSLGVVLCDVQREYEAAAGEFRKAVELQPEIATFHYNLGNALSHLEQRDEAIACFRKAIELNPKYATAYNNLGLELRDQDRLDEALDCFRKMLELDPHDALGHNNLGVTLSEKGKPEEAILCYRKALEHDPDYVVALDNLGQALYEQNELDEAITCFRRVLELDPAKALTHFNLGRAFKAKGQLDEAVACYRKAIELDPQFAEAYGGLGVILCDDRRDYEAAVTAFRRAVELQPETAGFHFNLGNALDKQGNRNEASACFRRAIELDPKFAEAHNALGAALADQGELDEAIACYRTATELDPTFVSAYVNLGQALKNEGQSNEAIRCLHKAIEINPNDANAHNGLGTVLCDLQRDYNAAAAEFRMALEQEPQNALFHFNLGNALRNQGKLDEAADCYQTAIELEPKYADAHNNLGIVFRDQGQLEEAIACFRAAIKFAPEFAQAYTNLILALLKQGKTDEAGALYDKAIELDLKDANAFNDLGVVQRDLDKLEEAEVNVRKAIELDPKFALAYRNLGLVLLKQRKLDEAVNCFRKALELDPKYADAYRNLGVALRDQGHLDDAVACLRKAIELDPKNADACNDLGIVLCDFQRDYEAAEAAFRKAIERMPANAVFHHNLGNALSNQGKLDEAISSYRKAVELDPNYVNAYLGLGDTLAARGQLDEAITCYRKVIEVDPNRVKAHFNLGILLADRGQPQEAIACFKRVLELDPKNTGACNNLGLILLSLGQVDDAIDCYRKAIGINSKEAATWLNLGYAQYFSGKHSEAVASFEKGKELAGENFSTPSRLLLVMAYWYAGNQDAARKCYAEAVARDNKPSRERTEAEKLLGIDKPEPKSKPEEPKPDKPAPPDGAIE